MILMEWLNYPCTLQGAAAEVAASERNEGKFSDASKCTNKRAICFGVAPEPKAGE